MTPSVLSLTKTSARSQPGEDHNLAPLDCPVAADERQQMLVRWCILHSPGLPRGVHMDEVWSGQTEDGLEKD